MAATGPRWLYWLLILTYGTSMGILLGQCVVGCERDYSTKVPATIFEAQDRVLLTMMIADETFERCYKIVEAEGEGIGKNPCIQDALEKRRQANNARLELLREIERHRPRRR